MNNVGFFKYQLFLNAPGGCPYKNLYKYRSGLKPEARQAIVPLGLCC